MSAPVRLATPRLRIVLGNPEDPETWQALEVQSVRTDMIRAESEAAKKKIDVNAHPVLLSGYIAYYALLRSGQIEGSYADFDAGAIEVTTVDDEYVDPTQPGPTTG